MPNICICLKVSIASHIHIFKNTGASVSASWPVRRPGRDLKRIDIQIHRRKELLLSPASPLYVVANRQEPALRTAKVIATTEAALDADGSGVLKSKVGSVSNTL